MSAQLARIHAYIDERTANEGLYDFQRTGDNTMSSLLCYLLGAGAISDEHLDGALNLARETDAKTVAHRAKAAAPVEAVSR